jgi:predicted Zn finger-like uncharacterized protein
MATTTSCPSCNRALRVPEELIGKSVKCPTCGKAFTAINGAETAPPTEEERRPVRQLAPPPDDYDDEEPEQELRPSRRRRRRYVQEHRGTLILVFGILGLVVFQPLGIAAWVMGNHDLAEMRAGRMDREGEGATNAGRICGIIATILMIVSLVAACCIGSIILMAAAGAAANAH